MKIFEATQKVLESVPSTPVELLCLVNARVIILDGTDPGTE
jgi:hypothetical protein